MYKVYEVTGGYQIFWCPSAPIHFNDRTSYDGRVYKHKAAAYRRVKQLNDALKKKDEDSQVALVV